MGLTKEDKKDIKEISEEIVFQIEKEDEKLGKDIAEDEKNKIKITEDILRDFLGD